MFNIQSYKIIFRSKRNGLTVDYAMPGIMATISALAGKSTVQSLNKRLGCCFYTLLAAQPSTGKSSAQELSQLAVTMLEKHFNVNPTNNVMSPQLKPFVE